MIGKYQRRNLLVDEIEIQALLLRNRIADIIQDEFAFCGLPGTKLSKLKNLHSEVFTKIHWGRFMVFLNFAEQLDLTEEE